MKLNVNEYSFLPWLRRGLSNRISNPDNPNDTTKGKRAILQVTGKFERKFAKDKTISELDEEFEIPLVGPGDILGIDAGAIERVNPSPGLNNFESNYYPSLDFFDEDFPWRYTPAAPAGNENSGKRLRPWIALLVCKRNEFSLHNNSDGFLYVKLKIEDEKLYNEIFPPAGNLWACAHVQYNGAMKQNLSADNLSKILSEEIEINPDIALSRLLSTRNLEDNRSYSVFLVPSFETGRLAGLGKAIDEIPVQQGAWESSYELQKKRTNAFEFPVYYHWDFETASGNFDVLAKRLKATDLGSLPADLKVDVSNMGNGFEYAKLDPRPKREVLNVPAATIPINYENTPYPVAAGDEAGVAKLLRELLGKNPVLIDNRLETSITYTGNTQGIVTDDPWVVPPLHGAKHIMATTLEENVAENITHPWFTELNLDVRHRAAAGMGKKAIQNNQEELVHRAWEQVELINELNQMLREYLLKLRVDKAVFDSKFSSKYVGNLLTYLQPMKYASVNGTSLKEILDGKGIPSAYVSATFQRMSTYKGIQQEINPVGNGGSIMDNIAKNNIYALAPHDLADLISAEQIKNLFKPDKKMVRSMIDTLYLKQIYSKFNKIYFQRRLVEIVKSQYSEEYLVLSSNFKMNGSEDSWASYWVWEDSTPKVYLQDSTLGQRRSVDAWNVVYKIQLEIKKDIEKYEQIIIDYDSYIETEIIKGDEKFAVYRDEGEEFFDEKSSGTDAVGSLGKKVDIVLKIMKDIPVKSNVLKSDSNIEKDTEELCDELDPNKEMDMVYKAIGEYFTALLNLPESKQKEYIDNYVEELTHSQYPVVAYPIFPEPTYYYLKQLSGKYILPAVDEMAMNSMILLRNNPAFVEAFLCGMNTEMGKELLWREFPTDSRGSYFRKFWDTEDADMDMDTYFDILPVHKWDAEQSPGTHRLGENHTPGKADLLVFAIKGELMKKYPGTLVYLHEGKIETKNGVQTIKIGDEDAKTVAPELSAWLTDSVYIVGFPGVLKDFAGDPTAGDPGYFLIFQERPTSVQFKNPEGETFGQYASKLDHAGIIAAGLIDNPALFGKHVCQFLKKVES